MLANNYDLSFFGSEKNIYKGVIEDNNDPLKIGRVRVRVLGVHSHDKNLVPIDTLPWCSCVKSLDFGGFTSGKGVSSVPVTGTWVFCVSENSDLTRFIVLGGIAGVNGHILDADVGFKDPLGIYPKEEYKGKSDHNLLNVSNYLNNHVIETPSGHLIEVNDNGHIKITHTVGSYIQILPDGTINVEAKKDLNINVVGNSNITTAGNTTIDTAGTNLIKSGGDTTVQASGNINATCSELSVNSSGNANVMAGGTGKFKSSGLMTIEGSAVMIKGGSTLMV